MTEEILIISLFLVIILRPLIPEFLKIKEKIVLVLKNNIFWVKDSSLLSILFILITIYFAIKIYLEITSKIEQRKDEKSILNSEFWEVKELLKVYFEETPPDKIKELIKSLKLSNFHKQTVKENKIALEKKRLEAEKYLIELKHKEKLNKLKKEKLNLNYEIEELEKDSIPEKIRKVVNIRVNENKRFFRKSKLSKDEIKYLLREGYSWYRYKSLVSEKVEEFLLKPRLNESAVHHFVTYDLGEYLESQGIEIEK